MMSHDTVEDREISKVAAELIDDSPRVDEYSAARISLKCNRCPFKTL